MPFTAIFSLLLLRCTSVSSLVSYAGAGPAGWWMSVVYDPLRSFLKELLGRPTNFDPQPLSNTINQCRRRPLLTSPCERHSPPSAPGPSRGHEGAGPVRGLTTGRVWVWTTPPPPGPCRERFPGLTPRIPSVREGKRRRQEEVTVPRPWSRTQYSEVGGGG